MKVSELITEGAFVVKNKDGKEKRFKSAESPDALAWKNSSTAKKKAAEKYSDEWWDEKKKDFNYDGRFPDERISADELGGGVLADILKDETGHEINDFSIRVRNTMKVGSTTVARAMLRVVYEFDMRDMGYDEKTIAQSGNTDGKGLESMYINVRRDVKNPSKIVFAGYANNSFQE